MVQSAGKACSPGRGSMESDDEMGGLMPSILKRLSSESLPFRYLITTVGGALVSMPVFLYVWAGAFYWWSLILTTLGGYLLSELSGEDKDQRE